MKNAIILVLSILVIGLGSYVIFDKLTNNDNNENAQDTIKNNDSQEKNENNLYTYENIEGSYVLNEDIKLKEKYVINKNITVNDGTLKQGTTLNLFKNGTFHYITNITQNINGLEVHNGEDIVGNYIINDDTIILNYWFTYEDSPTYSSINKSIQVKINNNIIEDSNIGNIVFKLEKDKDDVVKDTSFTDLTQKRYVISEKILNEYIKN